MLLAFYIFPPAVCTVALCGCPPQPAISPSCGVQGYGVRSLLWVIMECSRPAAPPKTTFWERSPGPPFEFCHHSCRAPVTPAARKGPSGRAKAGNMKVFGSSLSKSLFKVCAVPAKTYRQSQGQQRTRQGSEGVSQLQACPQEGVSFVGILMLSAGAGWDDCGAACVCAWGGE